ncbi:hypothetical protein O7626_40100 [Micromonospora sp. WMMD1102]|uniref:hypothetical protein n=1 Tax=Micromonospora sp. WMMD1102 TaxID=3016105 RepID=UPI002414E15D|nr:hypothetical protein [Micromonospora sp. WMMD1102]MDG4792020.1 hypothetical protein [Micromonospora sp. WMMD1102]
MTLTLPLAVRLSTARGEAHITRRLRDLSWRITAPGGFASITMSLHEPIAGQPDWLAYYGRAYIYDQRTGAVLCEGRLEDPGRSAGPDGQVWDLVAVGPAAHARDRHVPLIYVDRSLERWIPRDGGSAHPKADRRADVDASDNPVLRFQPPTGTSWAQNRTGTMGYPHLRYAGLKLGAFNASGTCGANTTNWRWQQVTRTPAGVGTVARDVAFTAPSISTSQRVASLSFPAGDDWVEMRVLQQNASAQTPSDAIWCTFGDLYVMQVLVNESGTELYEPAFDYPDGYLTADQVIRDLLGRLLPQYDGPRATIAATSYQIRELAYPDGVDAATVLDDLMRLEPAYLWEALESNAAGKHRFNWRQWPTEVRYEADVGDAGYDAPGSADGLYNEVTVRWRDATGQTRTTRVTQSVPELTAAGLTRSPKPLDLGDEVGSSTEATQAGQQFLAEHRAPPNGGRLRLSRPVLDLMAGTRVAPWEVRPGYLIRVRGVLPRPDALNATTRDGVTVFKIASTEFRASDATATLELDTFAPSTARALATLLNRPLTRRR